MIFGQSHQQELFGFFYFKNKDLFGFKLLSFWSISLSSKSYLSSPEHTYWRTCVKKTILSSPLGPNYAVTNAKDCDHIYFDKNLFELNWRISSLFWKANMPARMWCFGLRSHLSHYINAKLSNLIIIYLDTTTLVTDS